MSPHDHPAIHSMDEPYPIVPVPFFRPTSHFTPTPAEQEALDVKAQAAGRPLPRALFATTTAGWQGEVVEIRTGQLRSWWHAIDDILILFESGEARDHEQAVGDLERFQDDLDGLIRSANATPTIRPDRPSR